MRTIWKFPIPVSNKAVIELPRNSFFLFVANQNDKVCAWFEVETDFEMETRTFLIHGTGHPIPPGEFWRGSAIVGPFVWHVYEVV